MPAVPMSTVQVQNRWRQSEGSGWPQDREVLQGHGMKTAETALLHTGGGGEGRPTSEKCAEGKAGFKKNQCHRELLATHVLQLCLCHQGSLAQSGSP